MKIHILQTFTGFPDNTEASQTTFIAGASVEVADAFGALMVSKGLAREITSEPAKKATSKGDAT